MENFWVKDKDNYNLKFTHKQPELNLKYYTFNCRGRDGHQNMLHKFKFY